MSGKLPPLSLLVERRKCRPSRVVGKSNDSMNIQKLLMNLNLLYKCNRLLNYNYFFFFSFQKDSIWKLPEGVILKYYRIWTLQIMALSHEKKFRCQWIIERRGSVGGGKTEKRRDFW